MEPDTFPEQDDAEAEERFRQERRDSLVEWPRLLRDFPAWWFQRLDSDGYVAVLRADPCVRVRTESVLVMRRVLEARSS